jgi:hypothetical protein
MKPRLKFTTNGKYTGDYTGDVAINGALDEFNHYMCRLGQVDLCLYRFFRDTFIMRDLLIGEAEAKKRVEQNIYEAMRTPKYILGN